MILWLTLAQLGGGLLACTLLTPRSEVGDGELRFLTLWGGGLLLPLAAARGAGASLALAAVVVAALAIIGLSWGLGRLTSLLPAMAGGLGLAAAAVAELSFQRPGVGAGLQAWLLPADSVSSALLLGSTLGAMVLGHGYLVNQQMPIAPLCRLTALMAFAAAGKAMSVAANLMVFGWPPTRTDLLLTLLLPPGLLYVARAGVGILGPLLLAPLAWRTARMHSTQSATGILYAAVVLALIGEMTGKFLLMHTGFPF